jgi:hypothetical protein
MLIIETFGWFIVQILIAIATVETIAILDELDKWKE